MPELPEVETIRRGLEARLRGARISRVEVREPRLRRRIDRRALRGLVGRTIEGVTRRAKYLLFHLGGEVVWLVHLGMSGRILLVPADAPRGEHEHVRLEIDGGVALAYRDPRRFGLMRVGREHGFEELRRLGPEPLGDGFGAEWLGAKLRSSRRDVKAALLDQRLVAGIGNIYANEILFRAGVRPTRRCLRLRPDEIARVAAMIKTVLAEAIEFRGTSFSDYLDVSGEPGSFQEVLRVFDREAEPCCRCGRAIRRRPHGGRSSFYCPRCQV